MPMLTARECRLLDGLAIGANDAAPQARPAGARVARTRGFSTEFDDFRRYQPGDDPRTIDWTVHARLGQLVVRVFRGDARLRVHLLIDRSGSMGVGTPNKLMAATRIAAALAYVADGAHEEFGLATLDDTIRQVLTPAAGRWQLQHVLGMLQTVVADGRSSLGRALADYASLVRGPGVVVVMSDFFDEGGPISGLRALLHRGLVPAVVQIVASEDLDPDGTDEVEIVDSEDDQRPPIVVDGRAVRAYHERVEQLSSELATYCHSNGLPYVRVDASLDFERVLQACLPAGLLTTRA